MFIAYCKVIASLLIWGSVPLFVNLCSHSSSEIVMWRVVLAFGMLLLLTIVTKSKVDRVAWRKHVWKLILVGAVMGASWVFLFEAYRYVNVSVASLAYYCNPIIVTVLSPILLKEKLKTSNVLGLLAAVVGMILVTGATMDGLDPIRGILYGLLAASMYASIVLVNKTVSGIPGLQKTLLQMGGAILALVPYELLTHEGAWIPWEGTELLAILLLGLFHAGFGCYLYFSSIDALPAQSIALLSYIDPVSALFFAAIFLQEMLSPVQWVGAVLIIGGAILGETGERFVSKLLPHKNNL